jgi:hypothetical protein
VRTGALVLGTTFLLASCALVEEEALLDPSVVTVVQPPVPDSPDAPPSTVPTSEPCATLLAVDDPETGTLTDVEIAARYSNVVDTVPQDLREDLLVVIAGLRSESLTTVAREIVVPSTTMAPNSEQTAADTAESIAPEVLAALDNEPDAEGRTPELSPVDRIAAYVEETCRGVVNNPGPPPGTVAGGPTD